MKKDFSPVARETHETSIGETSQASPSKQTEGVQVALYLRVSTDEQTTQNQMIQLQDFCRYRGWSIDPAYTYCDEGVSGRKANRPALDRMMGDIRAGKIQRVICWKLDRLGRSIKNLATILEEFRKYDVQFTTSTEQIDTKSAAGELFYNMLGSFAQFESSLISERTRSGMHRVAKEGKKFGQPLRPVDMPALKKLHGKGYSARRISRTLDVPLNRVLSRISGLQARV